MSDVSCVSSSVNNYTGSIAVMHDLVVVVMATMSGGEDSGDTTVQLPRH